MADNYTFSPHETLGARGRTRASFVTTQHPRYTWEPESWEQTVRMIKPNGTARYTACFDKARKKKVKSVIHHWNEQLTPNDFADITGVYTASGLSAAYSINTSTDTRRADGEILYVKMTAADAKKFTNDFLVRLQDHTYGTNYVYGVTGTPVINGASSYVPVTLVQADNNYPTSAFAADDADTLYIISPVMEEGDLPPKAIHYEHESLWNCTQIVRTSLRMTRTAMQTGLRTAYDVAMAKRECLLRHQARKEKALLFGFRDADNTGPDGYPARLTGGLDYFISTNRFDWKVDKGDAWKTSGWSWLRSIAESMLDYKGADGGNGNRRTVLCGQGVWNSMSTLLHTSDEGAVRYNTTPMTDTFGGTCQRFEHAGMIFDFTVHPQLTYHPFFKYSAFFLEDSCIKQFYLQDDFYKKKVGDNGFDGQWSEFIWEGGFQIEGERLMAVAHNFGAPGL